MAIVTLDLDAAGMALLEDAIVNHDAANDAIGDIVFGALLDAGYKPPVDACPGCGRMPGQGVNPACNAPMGCGYAKTYYPAETLNQIVNAGK